MNTKPDMSHIVLPIVHLNGTSAESLINARDEAYRALSDALMAFREVAPNGRDYYPDPGRMERAVAQHQRRCETIYGLMLELEYEVGEIEEHKRS